MSLTLLEQREKSVFRKNKNSMRLALPCAFAEASAQAKAATRRRYSILAFWVDPATFIKSLIKDKFFSGGKD